MPLLRAKDAEIARLRMAGEGTQVTVGRAFQPPPRREESRRANAPPRLLATSGFRYPSRPTVPLALLPARGKRRHYSGPPPRAAHA
jgi:hypothetical protein